MTKKKLMMIQNYCQSNLLHHSKSIWNKRNLRKENQIDNHWRLAVPAALANIVKYTIWWRDALNVELGFINYVTTWPPLAQSASTIERQRNKRKTSLIVSFATEKNSMGSLWKSSKTKKSLVTLTPSACWFITSGGLKIERLTISAVASRSLQTDVLYVGNKVFVLQQTAAASKFMDYALSCKEIPCP